MLKYQQKLHGDTVLIIPPDVVLMLFLSFPKTGKFADVGCFTLYRRRLLNFILEDDLIINHSKIEIVSSVKSLGVFFIMPWPGIAINFLTSKLPQITESFYSLNYLSRSIKYLVIHFFCLVCGPTSRTNIHRLYIPQEKPLRAVKWRAHMIILQHLYFMSLRQRKETPS